MANCTSREEEKWQIKGQCQQSKEGFPGNIHYMMWLVLNNIHKIDEELRAFFNMEDLLSII